MVTDKAGLCGNLDVDCNTGRSGPRLSIALEPELDLVNYREAMDEESEILTKIKPSCKKNVL